MARRKAPVEPRSGFTSGLPKARPVTSFSPNLMEYSNNPTGTQAIIEKLRGAQPWLRFLGIMSWIGAAMLLLLAGILLLVAAANNSTDPDLSPGKMVLASFLYAGGSLLYVYPAILFLRAARHIRNLGSDTADIVEAIDAQRRIWKYIGIYLIVVMCLVALLFGFGILLGISQALKG